MPEPLEQHSSAQFGIAPPRWLFRITRLLFITCLAAIPLQFVNGFDADDPQPFALIMLIGGLILAVLSATSLLRYQLTADVRGGFIFSLVVGVLALAFSVLMPSLHH